MVAQADLRQRQLITKKNYKNSLEKSVNKQKTTQATENNPQKATKNKP